MELASARPAVPGNEKAPAWCGRFCASSSGFQTRLPNWRQRGHDAPLRRGMSSGRASLRRLPDGRELARELIQRVFEGIGQQHAAAAFVLLGSQQGRQ